MDFLKFWYYDERLLSLIAQRIPTVAVQLNFLDINVKEIIAELKTYANPPFFSKLISNEVFPVV